MVLFYVMAEKGWPIMMEGCVAATNTAARLYFIAYYGVAVTLVLTVLVAFFIEAYALKREKIAHLAASDVQRRSLPLCCSRPKALAKRKLSIVGHWYGSYCVCSVPSNAEIQACALCSQR